MPAYRLERLAIKVNNTGEPQILILHWSTNPWMMGNIQSYKKIWIIDLRKYHFIHCTLQTYQHTTPSILFTWLIFCSPTPSPAKPFTGSRRYLFQMYLSFGALLYATKEGKDRLSILALLALSGMAWYYKWRDDYTSISMYIILWWIDKSEDVAYMNFLQFAQSSSLFHRRKDIGYTPGLACYIEVYWSNHRNSCE